MNTLVFSLVNLSATGNNPASMNALISIGGERINLNQSSISGAGATQPAATGLFYQATFLLKKTVSIIQIEHECMKYAKRYRYGIGDSVSSGYFTT